MEHTLMNKQNLKTKIFPDPNSPFYFVNPFKKIWELHSKKPYQRNIKRYDPKHKLNLNMAIAIGHDLKYRGSSKDGRHWETLVGYTKEELMAHLENLFQLGMTWKNQSKWHIDHVKPKILFNFKTAEDPEFKKCWALKNLQPLWAGDNNSKGSKYALQE